MKKVEIALIGAGQRGYEAYGPYALAHPNEISFCAVVEKNEERLKKFGDAHEIKEENRFSDWDDFFAKPKMCDAVLICTQDRLHFEPAMKAIEKGYDVFLEKPMSFDEGECRKIYEAAQNKGVKLIICHVLRYAPFYAKLKELLDQKVIGDLIAVQHNENVGYWHYAHAYVRGPWRNLETSSPALLAKSCHDLDMMNYLIGKRCLKISSFGSLKMFKEENAPEGCAKRCTDGCKYEQSCPFSALKIYSPDKTEWPRTVLTEDLTPEGIMKALKEGPYGRCVYYCDNDVVDHQVVNMEYEDGITVAFTMCGLTDCDRHRTIKFMGTKGQIRASSGDSIIEVLDFSDETVNTYKITPRGMHSGGDEGLMKYFVNALNGSETELSSPLMSLESHLMCFAAEESRLTGKIIDMQEYMNRS